jgi:glycosyltransferase involved in cell wall biosynthesis
MGRSFFLREVLPKVLSQFREATLYLVGARPDCRIRDAARAFGERVVITGRVPDVSEYLRKAVVTVCPVCLAIGVQTKVLEALVWGTPVVTTVEGNSGISGRSRTQLWVESTPDKLAMRVVELLRGENWSVLSHEGRAHVRTSFDWDTSATLLEGSRSMQRRFDGFHARTRPLEGALARQLFRKYRPAMQCHFVPGAIQRSRAASRLQLHH